MNPEDVPKYIYIEKTPTWLIRAVYSIGILTWLGVLYGYSLFFTTSRVYFFFVAPFVIFFAAYHILSYWIMLHYQQFDLRQHAHLLQTYDSKSLSLDKNEYPTVDIFITICGEDTEVLKKTFHAVSKLDYSNTKVYVLDDKGIAEHEKIALQKGFIYLRHKISQCVF